VVNTCLANQKITIRLLFEFIKLLSIWRHRFTNLHFHFRSIVIQYSLYHIVSKRTLNHLKYSTHLKSYLSLLLRIYSVIFSLWFWLHWIITFSITLLAYLLLLSSTNFSKTASIIWFFTSTEPLLIKCYTI